MGRSDRNPGPGFSRGLYSLSQQAAWRLRRHSPSSQRSASLRYAHGPGISRGRPGVGNAVELAGADLLFAGVLAVALWTQPRSSGAAGPWHSVLSYFGRVSYCLYLVHLFVFWSFDRLAAVHPPMLLGPIVGLRDRRTRPCPRPSPRLSWRYLEAPLLALKITGTWSAEPQTLRAAPTA